MPMPIRYETHASGPVRSSRCILAAATGIALATTPLHSETAGSDDVDQGTQGQPKNHAGLHRHPFLRVMMEKVFDAREKEREKGRRRQFMPNGGFVGERVPGVGRVVGCR